MKIYLAGHYLWIYLQGISSGGGILSKSAPKINVLESFFTVDDCITKLIPRFNSFMLDSGAFSFFNGKKVRNIDAYINRYIEYINKHNIELFFELDIDRIIGYDRVKNIRLRIEQETGKRPIPVWHKHLGKEEFLRMCDEYDYVAIGGIVSKEIMPIEYKYLPWFIDEAHKRGAKIHGLGFTDMYWLTACHFDSVDSTAWLVGNKFGYIWKFGGKKMHRIFFPPNTRLKHKESAANNFVEWLKFAAYAEEHL